LQNFDRERFLTQYWQRQPLLIEHALPDFTCPLSTEELSGLSLDADVESRLIENCAGRWEVEHGPFNEHSFDRDNFWTLLVQAVDHFVPAVADLRALINFLPQWRMDDVMVSYAPDGGSVGPHYDNYDVFLVQGLGQREWRLGQYCSTEEPLLEHDELHILKEFRERERHLLNPGDILYVPPRLAHWGIARGDCMTFSIGFRAPRLNDMLGRWTDQILENMDPELFYRDPMDKSMPRPGEINAQSISEAYNLLQRTLLAQMSRPNWFGELVTEPRYPVEFLAEEQDLDSLEEIHLDSAARLAWWTDGEQLLAFANGQTIHCGQRCLALLANLCKYSLVAGNDLKAARDCSARRQLLQQLLAMGCIHGGEK
jgi:50S ribosomal protein L16 3-hydroxylase